MIERASDKPEFTRVIVVHEDIYADEWRKQLLSLIFIIILSSAIWGGLWWILSTIYAAFSF